jgi:hypothetical protein
VDYDRACPVTTLAIARGVAARMKATRYVFATGVGMLISDAPPPFGQAHWRVDRDGSHTFIAHRSEARS